MKEFEKKFKKIASEIKIKYHDISLYFKAFTHTTYANEHHVESNERLEFIGDAILDFLVGEYIYKKFPDMDEGNMTKTRAKYVCEEANLTYVHKLKLNDLLLLGKGEEKQGGRTKSSVLGDLFEAFLGALYLDNNSLDEVRKVLDIVIFPFIEFNKGYLKDYKSELQELIQAENRQSVRYELIDETGLPNDKTFVMAVYFDGTKLGEGTGKSKKEAEQEAAKDALKKLVK